jgi:hypothetical protein
MLSEVISTTYPYTASHNTNTTDYYTQNIPPETPHNEDNNTQKNHDSHPYNEASSPLHQPQPDEDHADADFCKHPNYDHPKRYPSLKNKDYI